MSTCKGQRTISGVSPCLLPCLRQGLLIFFFSVAYVLPPPPIFLQERHLSAGAPSSCRSASITECTLLCTIISGFYVSSWNSNLGPHTFVAPPRPSQRHLSCKSPVEQLGTCKVQSQLNPSSALTSLCCPWMLISRPALNAPCRRHLSELVLGLSCYDCIVFPKVTS